MNTREEQLRVAALHNTGILDTPAEAEFDDIVELAAQICGTPIALVSLVDAARQWFKARRGIPLEQTPRAISFCTHAIEQDDLFVVYDAAQDARFRDNPFVAGEPHIRFYAGAPLIDPDGHALGTVCVVDHVPRELGAHQIAALRILARQAQSLIERHFYRKRVVAAESARERARVQCEEEHHRLEDVLATHQIGWFECAAGGDEFTCGGRLEELLATDAVCPPGDLRALIDCAYPADRPALAAGFARLNGERAPLRIQFRVMQANGALSHVECVARSEQAAAPRISGMLRDVTEQTHFLERLERKAALLETVNDFLPLALAYVSTDRRVLWSNRRNAQRHGLEIQDIVGKTLGELLTTAHLNAAATNITGVLDGKRHQEETVVENNDGSVTRWEKNLLPHRHGDGSIAGYIILCREIAASAEHSAPPAVTEHSCRRLLDELPAMVWRADARGALLYINAEFRHFTGLEPHALPGYAWEHLLDPADAGRCHGERTAAIAAGREFAIEIALRHRDGNYRPMLDRGVPVRDAHGRVIAYAGTCVELPATTAETQSRLSASLSQRAAIIIAQGEINQWSAMLAHDLRAPLRAISGFTTIVIEDYGKTLPTAAAAHLQRVERNIVRINDMIAGMLRLSQLSSVPIRRSEFAPAELIGEVIDDFADERHGRDIRIEIELPPRCRGDRILLRQVFHNLLSNALKYTRRCTASRIAITGYESESAYHFAVTDNGAGFDPKCSDKLFQLFSRTHSADEFPGVGVGLAVVKRVVERHGGCVTASTSHSQGAQFQFTLPKILSKTDGITA